VLSTNTRQDLAIEEFEFYSEPNVRVPGWFLKPSSAKGKLPVAVILSSSGKNRIFDDLHLLAAVNELNIALCAIDPRASGQATPRLPSSGPLFYGHGVDMAYSLVSLTAGFPLIGQRVSDVLCCLDYLQARADVDALRIAIFGKDASGLEALFGAALDDRLRGVLLERTLADFASVVASADYNLKLASFPFGLLKHFDLPQIAAGMAPRPVWLLGPVDGKGDGIPVPVVEASYGSSAKVYPSTTSSGKVFRDWVTAALS
jgi:cephalosporin-C deacetylase-like acetyl esterase